MRCVDHLHQAVCNSAYVLIKPSCSYNFKKQIDKDSVHPHYCEKLPVFPVTFNIKPPVNNSKK